MHPNKAFRRATPEENLSFAAERGFGVMTLAGPEGPLASHIPFVLSPDRKTFGAHLVRSNPILKRLDRPQPALMVVSGPDAYVSPDWYGVDDQVPTWNYVAVHLRGTLKALPASQLRFHLQALSGLFEQRLAPKPVWKLDKVNPDALAKLEKMIVPVEFAIDSTEGTWKLSQNKPQSARLEAADFIGNPELASLMKLVKEFA